MPIFEYKCDKCGKEFEEIVFGTAAEVKCPACGSDKTGKLMSCCRHKAAGDGADLGTASAAPAGGGGGCAGCSGGDCSTCG
ncbi:MAG: zinc ribbon domain-containing protein [Proteobacteria bacterium]|nr:zinc ribbon domain-containing protein [Pseudomonadota bacterium]